MSRKLNNKYSENEITQVESLFHENENKCGTTIKIKIKIHHTEEEEYQLFSLLEQKNR